MKLYIKVVGNHIKVKVSSSFCEFRQEAESVFSSFGMSTRSIGKESGGFIMESEKEIDLFTSFDETRKYVESLASKFAKLKKSEDSFSRINELNSIIDSILDQEYF